MNKQLGDLQSTPFRMVHRPNDQDYPGYWIFMDDRSPEGQSQSVSLILFMGLPEEAAESIFSRLNLYLLNYLIDVGFIELPEE